MSQNRYSLSTAKNVNKIVIELTRLESENWSHYENFLQSFVHKNMDLKITKKFLLRNFNIAKVDFA